MGIHLKQPTKRWVPGEYRRKCDRCFYEGYLRSELSREDVTNLLVCQWCKDEYPPTHDPKKRSPDLYMEKVRQFD